MKHWGSRLAQLTIGTALLLLALAAWAYWVNNRDTPAVTQEEIALRYDKVMGWMHANEATVNTNTNAALWWLLQAAAERTGDPYLYELLNRAKPRMFPPSNPALVWKRMLEPKADIVIASNLSELLGYQQFFHHALTCTAIEGPEGNTSAYLDAPACRPVPQRMLKGDPACTTHQLMGLRLFKQTGCTPPHDLSPLEQALTNDIVEELTLDPVMKDAYIQRVLMLVWQGHADQVKPTWLRRALEAQDADGGWQGHRRMPELPSWLQPWQVRELLARHWPKRFPPEKIDHDFHATAQGLLLLALLKTPQGGTAAAPRAMQP